MTAAWAGVRDRADAARATQARATLRQAGWAERLDGALLGLCVLLLIGLLAAGFGAARLIDRTGAFDPEILRPLPDRRILDDLHSNPSPYIGAARMNAAGDTVALMRRDGTVTIYDPLRQLASGDDGFRDLGLATPAIALADGCGGTVDGAPVGCAPQDTLLVLTEGGGLATRRGGDWRTLISDHAWTGLSGKPVEQEDVTAWAVDGSGRWTLIAAGAEGLAFHDERSGGWTTVQGTAPYLAALEVGPVEIHPDGAAFWLTSARGIGRIAARADAQLEWSERRDFAILALAVPAAGRRFAVVEGPCADGAATGCRAIHAVDGPDDLPVLVGETALHPDLAAAGVRHVASQDGRLVTVGAAGIHAYDPDLRAWRALTEGRVDAFAVEAGGDILAATGDRLLRVARGTLTENEEISGAPYRQLTLVNGRLIGLNRDGEVRDPRRDSPLLSPRNALPDGITFHAGAQVGNLVLLATTDGILLHDVAARRYVWKPAPSLGDAGMLTGKGVRLWGGAGVWFATETASGRVLRLSPVGRDDIEVTAMGTFAGPLRSATASDAGLTVVDALGVPWDMARAGDPVPRLGAAYAGGPLRTVAPAADGGLFVSDGLGIHRYNRAARDWQGGPSSPDASGIDALGAANVLVAKTGNGAVWRLGDGGWEDILNGGAAAMGSGAVTDALASDRGLFFGGAGQVQAYDPAAGRWGTAWSGAGGSVRIVGVQGERPLWLTGGTLRLGDAVLLKEGVRDAWIGPDGILAETGQGATRRAVIFDRTGAGRRCVFGGSDGPSGALVDATGLGQGRVLAVTSAGAAIHDAATRRWIDVALPPLRPGGRLMLLGDRLAGVTPGAMWSVARSDLPDPDTCDDAAAAPEPDALSGRSVAADRQSAQVAVLDRDGAIRRWSPPSSVQQILPPPTPGPRQANILTVAQIGDVLFAVTPEALWDYDLTTRIWRRRPLSSGPGDGPVLAADLRPGTGTVALTTWTASGARGAVVAETADEVTLAPLAPLVLPRLGLAPQSLLSLTEQGGIWAAASATAVEFADLNSGAVGWVTLPDGTGPVPGELEGLTVFEGAGAVHLIPADADLPALSGPLASVALRHVPGDDRGWGIEAAGTTLVRIDQAGRVLRCAVVAGRDTARGCAVGLKAPTRIEETDITDAARDGTAWHYVAGSRVYRTAATLRDPVAFDGPRGTPEGRFLERGDLYWEGPGAALWRLGPDRGAVRVAASVDDIRSDGGGHLLRTGDAVVALPSLADRPVAPTTQAGDPLTAATVDWATGQGRLTGIAPTGLPVTGDGAPLLGQPLRDIADVRQVMPGRFPNGPAGVWVRRADGSVQHIAQDSCRSGPPPVPETSCLRTRPFAGIDSSEAGALLAVETAGDEVVLRFARAVITLSGGTVSRDATAWTQAEPSRSLRNRLRALVRPGPDGAGELAPAEIVSGCLRIEGRGDALVPNGPSGWDPLDLGWMRWNAGDRSVTFAGRDAPQTFPGADAFREGVVLPLRPGRASLAPDGDFAWLTDAGLWSVSGQKGTPLWVAPGNTAAPLGVAQGHFLLPDGRSLRADDGTADTDSDIAEIVVGALTLRTRLRAAVTEGLLIRDDGGTVDAFDADGGFAHDRRLGIGWDAAGRLRVATPVGLVPAKDLSDVLVPPPGAPVGAFGRDAGGLVARGDGIWFRRAGPGRWDAIPDPDRDRGLAAEDGLLWELADGALTVTAPDPADDWRSVRSGLDFAADRLESLAASTREGLVGTALGTHRVARLSDIAALPSAMDATPPRAPFATLRQAGADDLPIDGEGRVWDAGSWRAARPGEGRTDPRVIADRHGLRATVGSGGGVAVERHLETVDGGVVLAGLEWRGGGAMPMDQALSLHGDTRAIWVGTRLGLRRFGPDGAPTGDLLAVGTPGPVAAIGRPVADSDRQVALSATGCVDLSGPVPVACVASADLTRYHVMRTGGWVWTDGTGGPEGRYRLATGPVDGPAMQIGRDGRWPHDTLLAAAQGTELWSDRRYVTVGAAFHRLEEPADGLHVQSVGVPLGAGAALDPGPYLTGATPRTLRADGSTAALTPPQANAVAARSAGAVAFDAGRLRIDIGAFAAGYLYRDRDDRWAALPFAGPLPAIDETRAILGRDGRLERQTGAGLLSHAVATGGGGLVIDPDALRLRDGTGDADLAGCGAVDLGTDPQDRILLRCDDGRVLTETGPASGDRHVLMRRADDPFATRIALEQGPWLWTRLHPDPSVAPAMEIRFRDEDVDLSAGRFSMDAFLSVAVPFPGRIDIAAQDGHWRQDGPRLALDATARDPAMPDAATVRRVTAVRDDDGPLLCAEDAAGAALTLDAQGRPRSAEACEPDRGQSALWHYTSGGRAAPQAQADTFDGTTLQRRLSGGRFDDRRAVGMPRFGADGILLVPIARGVAALDGDGLPTGLQAIPTTRAVVVSAGGEAAVLSAGGVRPAFGASPADPACPALETLGAALGGVTAVSVVRDGTVLQVAGRSAEDGATFRATVPCAAAATPGPFQTDLPVAEKIRHRAVLSEQAGTTALLRVSQADAPGVLILSDGRLRSLEIETGSNGPLLETIGTQQGRTIVFVTPGMAFLIDVGAALSGLSRVAPEAVETPSLRDRPAAAPTPRPTSKPVAPQSPVARSSASPLPPVSPVPARSPVDEAGTQTVPFADMDVATLERVQGALARAGHYDGTVDGIAGPLTRAAVVARQAEVGAAQTGTLTRGQLDDLLDAAP